MTGGNLLNSEPKDNYINPLPTVSWQIDKDGKIRDWAIRRLK